MQDAATIEQILLQSKDSCVLLSAAEMAGAWRNAFGEAAAHVPQPYWIMPEDELAGEPELGFPVRITPVWEAFTRELARLIEAEAAYRLTLPSQGEDTKAALLELRRAVTSRIADVLENAVIYDYGQRLPSIFWLVLTAETADRVQVVTRKLAPELQQAGPHVADELRYEIARRLVELANRAKNEVTERLRRADVAEPSPASQAFFNLLTADLIPFVERRISPDLRELARFLQGQLRLDAGRFQQITRDLAANVTQLRSEDPAFDRVLAAVDPEAPGLPSEHLPFNQALLGLLEVWPNAKTPRLSSEMRGLLADLTLRCKRAEVINALRDRIVPVSERGSSVVARLGDSTVKLSDLTRPLDFTAPGVLPSVVRRYGLLYDLIEFSHILEELRRRGRTIEEQAIRQMVRFLGQVGEIRGRHALKFEKFMGDGAFYSARNARSVLRAASELRLLYERLRGQGFPFDRGLRLAMNVGTYHLLPMVSAAADRPHFEFFGHGLVELARLTSGKTTHEVEDIADFFIAAGYDLHKVLRFMEPVRHAVRVPEAVRDRPYWAAIVENGELVNHGSVATEWFLRDLEVELGDAPMFDIEHQGLRWIALIPAPDEQDAGCVAVRLLGTPHLKGLEPMPIAEVAVLEGPPPQDKALPQGTSLLLSLQLLAAASRQSPAPALSDTYDVDPQLCVVSVLEEENERTWYVGLFEESVDALRNAFRIRLMPVGLRDGEPFEAWLFRRRGELAKLYSGLRRDSTGATVPLEDLRSRDGYFACLLSSPQRSPR